MRLTQLLINEVEAEIKQAEAEWGDIDIDPHELLNAVAEECLEVIHAVNHRQPPELIHREIVQAIGVLVRLNERIAGRTDNVCSLS